MDVGVNGSECFLPRNHSPLVASRPQCTTYCGGNLPKGTANFLRGVGLRTVPPAERGRGRRGATSPTFEGGSNCLQVHWHNEPFLKRLESSAERLPKTATGTLLRANAPGAGGARSPEPGVRFEAGEERNNPFRVNGNPSPQPSPLPKGRGRRVPPTTAPTFNHSPGPGTVAKIIDPAQNLAQLCVRT